MPFQRGGDNLVVLAIAAILAVLGYTAFQAGRAQKAAVDCLLASPEARRCPHAEGHLPAAAAGVGGPLAIPEWSLWATVDGRVVTRAPRFWWRWLLGPLLLLVGLAALLLCLVNLVIEAGRKPRQLLLLAIYATAGLLTGLLIWFVVRSSWGRESWTFDPAARTVKAERFLAGFRTGETLYADYRALAPVRGSRTALVLVGKHGRPVELFALLPDSLGVLSPLGVNAGAPHIR